MITLAKRNELLLKLADLIESVPGSDVDWREVYKLREPDESPEKFNLRVWSCGTVRCAIGWACAMPEFNEIGFTMDKDGSPTYLDAVSWDAVIHFMASGASVVEYRHRKDAHYLFDSDEYKVTNDSKVVADRIREYVRDSK